MSVRFLMFSAQFCVLLQFSVTEPVESILPAAIMTIIFHF